MITADSVAPSAAPDARGAPGPAGDTAPSATVHVLSTSPETASAPAEGEAASLALAISGLVKPAPPPTRTDRRGITLVAMSLMALDCVAIGTLRRRRAGAFNC